MPAYARVLNACHGTSRKPDMAYALYIIAATFKSRARKQCVRCGFAFAVEILLSMNSLHWNIKDLQLSIFYR